MTDDKRSPSVIGHFRAPRSTAGHALVLHHRVFAGAAELADPPLHVPLSERSAMIRLVAGTPGRAAAGVHSALVGVHLAVAVPLLAGHDPPPSFATTPRAAGGGMPDY